MTKDYSIEQIVEIRYVSAKVIAISSGARSAKKPSLSVGMVEIEDGRKVRLLFTTHIPEVGDPVPLRVEYFENGETFYSLDAERWRRGLL